MTSDNVRELTLEEMIELGYSEADIKAALDRKIKNSKAAQEKKKVALARSNAVTALKEYMSVLGIPAQEIEDDELISAFLSFEKQIAPALKVLAKLPKKEEPKSTLEESAFESALESLRRFADSL